MPSESSQGPNTDRILTAWINHSERVISFHPVPGFLRFRTRDADGFWAKIRPWWRRATACNSKKSTPSGVLFAVF